MAEPTYYWDACMFYEVLSDEPVVLKKRTAIQEILEENKASENVIFVRHQSP